MTTAAELLREARQGAGLTQAELAHRARVTQSVISAYERGRREPGFATLERLVTATGASLAVRVERTAPAIERRRGRLALVLEHRREIVARAAELGLDDVRLFGSAARGDDHAGSDIDLLVHRRPGSRGLAIFTLERQLEELLHVPVDVVPDSALGAAGEEALRPDLLAL